MSEREEGEGGVDHGNLLLKSKGNSNKSETKRQKREEEELWDSRSTKMKKLGLGVLFFALLFGGAISAVFSVFDFFRTDITHFDVGDKKQVKALFLGGRPWVVYCTDRKTRTKKLPLLVEETERELRGGNIRLGVIDCFDGKLPSSGKSIFERYKFSKNQMPMFVVAYGNKPVQLTPNAFSSAHNIVEFAKKQTAPRIKEVGNNKKLESNCYGRIGGCVIIGYKKSFPKEAREILVKVVMPKYYGLKFVSVDTSQSKLKLDQSILASSPWIGQKLFQMLCVHNPDRSSDPDALTSGRMLSISDLTELRVLTDRVARFFENCSSGEGLNTIMELPKLQPRPPKVPQEAIKNNGDSKGTKAGEDRRGDASDRKDERFMESDDGHTAEEVPEEVEEIEF